MTPEVEQRIEEFVAIFLFVRNSDDARRVLYTLCNFAFAAGRLEGANEVAAALAAVYATEKARRA